jgi:D-glycero-alpha-D-manno-heptose-7-phosphate kinase
MKRIKKVITKTPMRISFIGGGTDFPDYFNLYGGKVISSSINKYIYVTVKEHSHLFNEKFRLNYSETESVNNVNDIKNEITRACLNFLNIKNPLYISTISDLPTSSGLGSSSTFTVGLLNALHYYSTGRKASSKQLAKEASYIETIILKKPIGYQDHYAAAYGGLNKIFFKKNKVTVKKVNISKKKLNLLFDYLILIWSKIQRDSSYVLKNQKKNIKKNIDQLNELKKLVDIFQNNISKSKINNKYLGKIVDSSWNIKKKFSNKITNDHIDYLYEMVKSCGADGAKIIGAGAGGFLMVFSDKKAQRKIIKNLNKNELLKIECEQEGSKIIYEN